MPALWGAGSVQGSNPNTHTQRSTGVFGAHTAMVIRRLRRLCSRIYNSSPVFALTTATIANPREHAARLLASARLHGRRLWGFGVNKSSSKSVMGVCLRWRLFGTSLT